MNQVDTLEKASPRFSEDHAWQLGSHVTSVACWEQAQVAEQGWLGQRVTGHWLCRASWSPPPLLSASILPQHVQSVINFYRYFSSLNLLNLFFSISISMNLATHFLKVKIEKKVLMSVNMSLTFQPEQSLQHVILNIEPPQLFHAPVNTDWRHPLENPARSCKIHVTYPLCTFYKFHGISAFLIKVTFCTIILLIFLWMVLKSFYSFVFMSLLFETMPAHSRCLVNISWMNG